MGVSERGGGLYIYIYIILKQTGKCCDFLFIVLLCWGFYVSTNRGDNWIFGVSVAYCWKGSFVVILFTRLMSLVRGWNIIWDKCYRLHFSR